MKRALAVVAIALSAVGCRAARALAPDAGDPASGVIELVISAAYTAPQDADPSSLIGSPAAVPRDGLACADIELRPYRLDASRHRTFTGETTRFTLSYGADGGEPLAFAEHCTDSRPDAGEDAAPDWGAVVTASHFTDCNGSALFSACVREGTAASDAGVCQASPIPDVLVTDATMKCVGRMALGLPIELELGVATASGAARGALEYACKTTDVSGGSPLLHFGQSAVTLTDAGLPAHAFAAVGGAGGQLSAGDLSSNGIAGAYLTGVAQPAATAIFTTFADACGPGEEYADVAHFGCLTTIAPLATSVRLDALVASPAGFAAAEIASVDGGARNAISIVSSDAPVSMVAISESGIGPGGVPGPDLITQLLAASDLTGIFVDRSAADRFLVTAGAADGGAPQYATLAQADGGWALSPFAPLPDPATADCLGLFYTAGGCFTPAACGP